MAGQIKNKSLIKLAFYYHVPLTSRQGILYVPSYLGVFIDALAREVEELWLVMHESGNQDAAEADYKLVAKNIHWLNLGKKTRAWHRSLFHRALLHNTLKDIEECDFFVIRSPSPLAPYFYKYIKCVVPVFMIVGDYGDEAIHAKPKSFREWVMWRYIQHNDILFRKRMSATDIMVNSPALYEKYKNTAKSIYQIHTTTLSIQDFYYREDTCDGKMIELLYTGRIDPAKGLFELVEALALLRRTYNNIRLNIVGWESKLDKPVEKSLRKFAKHLGIEQFLLFHGRKQVGTPLNAMYRMGDIYVIPSHHEGFPRTIWEAMANSLPVIATRVGGIPGYLTHLENAFLVEPRSVSELASTIEKIIFDSDMRRRLIAGGYQIAKENTLEIQSKKIVETLKKLNSLT